MLESTSIDRASIACLFVAGVVTCSACSGSGPDDAGYELVTHPDGGADAGSDAAQEPPPHDAHIGVEADAPDDASSDAPVLAPYPIVLHHGFSGWQEANVGDLHYFYGVAEHLNAHGEPLVFETVVEPYEGIEVRAAQLAPQVDAILAQTGATKINIIAHSQGGLDARYLVSTLGYGDRVASLTTISTPHRGTRVADAILKLTPDWSDWLINGAADVIGSWILDVDSNADMRASMESLTEQSVKNSFNPANPDDSRVAYYSYAGRSNDMRAEAECAGSWYDNPSQIDHIDPLLYPTAEYLKTPGPGVNCPLHVCANDGMVTVQSARWGTFMGCFPADHFDEVGQIAMEKPNPESGYSQRDFYLTVVERIRERGH